jgi:FixJ family two-component response regulator
MVNQQNVVAIVDDDDLFREALNLLLSTYGFFVEPYASGEALLAGLAESKAACLIVDVELGGISGLELGRKLRAMGQSVPVILMTGSDIDTVARATVGLNHAGILQKPLNVAHLLEFIVESINTTASSEDE